MDIFSAKVSSPFVNNEADQSMEEEILTSKGRNCSARNKVRSRAAKLMKHMRRTQKRMADRKHQLEQMRLERMIEEIAQLKESVAQLQSSNRELVSQQHDAKWVSVQIEYLQDIRRLSTESRQLKEEVGLLSTENRQLKEEIGLLSTENRQLKEESGNLSTMIRLLKEENGQLSSVKRYLEEENSLLKPENEHLADVIKGLHGKSQLPEVPQRQDGHISQPTCQVDQKVYVQDNYGIECNNDDHAYNNNRCTENFGIKGALVGAIVGTKLETLVPKNSFFRTEYARLTDKIRRLKEDITRLRPDLQFPDRGLHTLGNHFFLSTSQQHNDDESVSVQSCGFQPREGIQDVQETGSSDAATSQNHT